MAETHETGAPQDLARELYWAKERSPQPRLGTSELRDQLHDLSLQLDADQHVLIPLGEGSLASPSPWRRRLKHVLFRGARPVSVRYDRLIAENAELTARLADRVIALEQALERLRGDEAGPEAGPEAGEEP